MFRRCVLMTLACLLPAVSWSAGLLREAAVRKTAAGSEITFVLAEPTDVTVRIVSTGQDQNVVRHLVCGVVGLEKAVAGLKPASLSQTITWDGKDDAGKAVPPGAYSVDIGVGLRAKMDGFLLDGHDTFFSEICAFGGSNQTGHVFTANLGAMIHRISFVREFDREGKYVRTVWPLNPNMDERLYLDFCQRADTSAWKQYDMNWKWGTKDYDGKWVLGELHDNNFGGLAVSSLTQTADGRIIGMRRIASPRAFVVWHPDGRVLSHCQEVAPWYKFGDPLRPHAYDSLNITSGPPGPGQAEGKLLYVTDVGQTAKGGKTKWGWVVGCFDATTLSPVNRFTWSGLKKLDEPVYYLGTLNEPGEDEAHFKAPTGVAIDEAGRFWVGDADCIKVYAPDGKFLKRLDAATPGFEKVVFSSVKIGANHKRGGIYVATGGTVRGGSRKLVKIDSLENLKIVWETPLTGRRNYYAARQVFVDSEADLVWVADGAGPRTLLRIEDKGETFEKRVIDGNVPGKLQKPQWMRADAKGRIYVLDMGRNAIIRTDIDGKTFKEIPVQVSSSDGYFCLDDAGNLYITEWYRRDHFSLRKFGPEGEPLKIGDKDALHFTAENDWTRDGKFGRVKGVCVAANGDIYVAGAEPFHAVAGLWKENHDVKVSWVNVYTKDGVLKKSKLIQMTSINDVQMGTDGVYAVEASFSASTGMRFQAERDENVPYWTLFNKLEKYSLEGGTQKGEGHLWSHPGVGYVNTMACGYECAGAQITVDEDDRIWIPEHVVYNVKAVDSAGNLIARIGSYGNADCDGDPGGANPKPDIPIAWPVAIARYKDYLLIADRVSARIVRCKLEYRDRREIAITRQE